MCLRSPFQRGHFETGLVSVWVRKYTFNLRYRGRSCWPLATIYNRGSGTHFANSREPGAVHRVRRAADCPTFLKHPNRLISITFLERDSFSIVVTREIFSNHTVINNLERIVCITTYSIR
jgi:hypothetical protein